MKTLKDSREPLRYNKLHKEASAVLGHRIWIKTFNDHLKRLSENGEVIRNEKSRYNVTYEPARNYTEEERKRIKDEKKYLDFVLKWAAKTSDLELRKRAIKRWIRALARKQSMVATILYAAYALTIGEEKEAQSALDEFFFRYRTVLDHFIKKLSKIDGITDILNEMRKEESQRFKKISQEFETVKQEVLRIVKRKDVGILEARALAQAIIKFSKLTEESL